MAMDPTAIAALATAAAGLIGAGIALKNRKRDDEGKAVQAATGIFESYKGLVDELQSTVARLVGERDAYQGQLDVARHDLAHFPEQIKQLEADCADLETRLAASIAQLTALGQQAQVVADEIRDVADEAEEAANGG